MGGFIGAVIIAVGISGGLITVYVFFFGSLGDRSKMTSDYQRLQPSHVPENLEFQLNVLVAASKPWQLKSCQPTVRVGSGLKWRRIRDLPTVGPLFPKFGDAGNRWAYLCWEIPRPTEPRIRVKVKVRLQDGARFVVRESAEVPPPGDLHPVTSESDSNPSEPPGPSEDV